MHVQEEPGEKGHLAETCTGSSSESGMEKASEQSPPAVNSQPPEAETQIVVKLEDPPPVLDSPQKSAR